MSDFSNVLLTATAMVFTGGFALAGSVSASADPAGSGSSSDINTLAVLTCGQSPDPSGPVNALYQRWRTNG